MTIAETQPTISHWGADAVDPSGRNLPSLKAKFLIEHMLDQGTVVEIGSGDGKVLRTLSIHRPGLVLHGCDVRDPDTPPDVYSFHRIKDGIEMADSSVDVVLIFDVLEHVPSPEATLAEAARVCRPGGRLVAFIPVEGQTLSWYQLYRRLLGRDLYERTKEHVQSFSHRRLHEMISRHFVINEARYAYHPLGQFMDATFFAAAGTRRVSQFWWKDNVYYNRKKSVGPVAATANRLLQLGNLVAWVESKLLSRWRPGSAGLLVEARSRK